jgi:hypothetical protein
MIDQLHCTRLGTWRSCHLSSVGREREWAMKERRTHRGGRGEEGYMHLEEPNQGQSWSSSRRCHCLTNPGALMRRLSDKKSTCRWRKEHRERAGVHACKREQKWWHHPHATLIETKKSINHKPNIKIKFRSRHWISDNKNFETRSHWLYFDNLFYLYFLITVIYSVIAITKRMKCQNKREQLENKFICHLEQ